MKKPIPFGKYYLLERINVGGMAEVFRAKAYGVEGFERLVAVKRILPNIAEDKEFIKMFIDEAKIAVQLNHANIAQIFDLGMVDGAYYIALEHVHGRDLRAIFDRCRNHGEPMPVAQACFCLMKVCEGLDYAHNKRDSAGRELHLVHRDVSPQNILVSFEGEVKLIDFGIAKAAGKGAKTQAGILKGKFGYMSPEQVRGLPIDRRSDIFSCGICLYELLTGERLFVGESDFSTLEKVRNVEILPPSTYNRKIPDELERIVLKALAKDVEDRYQNAIDLHDELQAFVYTAGEFYSRKDLAGWMKRVFAKEIEDESSKLDAYRRLRPPEVRPPQRRQVRPTAPESPRSTLAMPTMAPPPPQRGNGQPAAGMQAAPAVAPPDLEWDDDELETQIYDNPDDSLAPRGDPAPAQMGPGMTPPPMAAGPGLAADPPAKEPDLSSLVQTAKGWDTPPLSRAPEGLPAPNLAAGSNNTPSPFSAEATYEEPGYAPPVGPDDRDPSAVVRLVNMAEPIFDGGFGEAEVAPFVEGKSRTGLVVGVILAILLLAGGAVGIMLYLRGQGGEDEVSGAATTEEPATPDSTSGTAGTPGTPAVALSPEVLDETGFDLYVEPAAIGDKLTIKLDGKLYATAPPMRFRKLTPGDHVVDITAPEGYRSKSETVTVVAGEAGRVTIALDTIAITGKFTSEPPGAVVTLVSGGEKQELGPTPVEAKLDPAKRYEVVFEKDGYVTQTKPIEFTGRAEEPVVAVLERTRVAAVRDNSHRPTRDRPSHDRTSDKVPDKAPDKVPDKVPDKTPDKVPDKTPDKSGGDEWGTIGLGSRPPCTIFIDGRNTGNKTPQRDIKLKAGRHKVTLVNNEYNIKETFTITVKEGKNKPVVKNLMDRVEN